VEIYLCAVVARSADLIGDGGGPQLVRFGQCAVRESLRQGGRTASSDNKIEGLRDDLRSPRINQFIEVSG
jgi:hypothetical protein